MSERRWHIMARAAAAPRLVAAAAGGEDDGDGMWMLFPAFGGDADCDFKEVRPCQDHAAAGNARKEYANGGGWEKLMGTVAHMPRCDDALVCNVSFVRKLPQPTAE